MNQFFKRKKRPQFFYKNFTDLEINSNVFKISSQIFKSKVHGILKEVVKMKRVRGFEKSLRIQKKSTSSTKSFRH